MSYNEFVAGDRVEVAQAPCKYRSITVGLVGTVTNVYSPSSIRVHIDGHVNVSSQYGDFYLEHRHLKRINNTPNNEGSFIMNGKYRTAEVQFIEGTNTNTKYLYACYDDEIITGDICVVKSAHHGFCIAKVVGFVESTDQDITREIVGKVSFEAYNKRVEDRKRAEELRQMMNARAKQLQDIALFQMLSEKDADMADMLAEYQKLMEA